MSEQSWETLPVAVTKLERRKQNEEQIAIEITLNLENDQNMPASSREELEEQLAITYRNIGRYVAAIA
ncbi:hypothetical protein H7100_01980 [Candidatus Saccharibacteria bacterium]|nr:hypothetical protein [Candidatus Saccharibacteria bacterium]